ncbi:MAG: hypothetical protein L0G22_00400 [Propionibacteriaceae bacterium]|nr:hypothetical protein [Propionibacteriaceae bacterium]
MNHDPIGRPTTRDAHAGHKWWAHLLMCAPMFAIVGYLILTGGFSAGTLAYPLLCLVMMGVMMVLMNRGGSSHDH